MQKEERAEGELIASIYYKSLTLCRIEAISRDVRVMAVGKNNFKPLPSLPVLTIC